MEDTRNELERIQKELFSGDTVSLDELLEDEELSALLSDQEEPVSETEKKPAAYHNSANSYRVRERNAVEDRIRLKKKKDDRVILGLMITASALCLGIIGILAYWLTVFL